jgi:hypothetical protein
MPEIAYRIGKLIFYMFNEDGEPHHEKHVRVEYGDNSAVYKIETGDKIKGNLPTPQERIVRKILSKESNRKRLIESWDELHQSNAKTPEKIRFKF